MDPNSVMPENAPSWLAEYKDLILVLAGGFCAAFGGFVSTWYRARTARSIKMREEIGRQQVEIYNKALRLTGGLGAILVQGTSTDVLNWMQRENGWVLDSEVLLPQGFVECWHSVKLNVKSAKRQEQAQQRMAEGEQKNKAIEEIVATDTFNRGLIKATEEAIRKECGLAPFIIHRPPKPKGR